MSTRKCDVGIVITLKSTLSAEERFALHHCVRNFSAYPILFVGSQDFDYSVYLKAAPEGECVIFDREFFGSAQRHSNFLLSDRFYERMFRFDYILVHHLDAIAFRNNIEDWMNRSLDFVGSAVYKYDRYGSPLRWIASQNGGFSLRHTKHHLDVLNSPKAASVISRTIDVHLDMGGYTAQEEKSAVLRMKNKLKVILRNQHLTSREFIIQHCQQSERLGEDHFWSRLAVCFNPSFRVGSLADAQKFGIQNGLDINYCQLINELPFGCHGPETVNRIFDFSENGQKPQTLNDCYIWSLAHKARMLDELTTSMVPLEVARRFWKD